MVVEVLVTRALSLAEAALPRPDTKVNRVTPTPRIKNTVDAQLSADCGGPAMSPVVVGTHAAPRRRSSWIVRSSVGGGSTRISRPHF